MSVPFSSLVSKCCLALLPLLAIVQSASADNDEPKIEWQLLTPDLEHASVPVTTSIFTTSRIDLFRTALKQFDLRVIRAGEFGTRTSTADAICNTVHATLCLNGSFFDEQYRPLGLIIEKGNTLQKIHKGGNTITGIVEKTKDGVSIVHRLDFTTGRVLEALQAGPRLISRGQPVPGLHESVTAHRRSGVCVDPDKRLILYTVIGNVFGVPIATLQKILLHRDIACWDALNLDGGSSTQLYYAGQSPLEIKGEDEVPVFVALVPKE